LALESNLLSANREFYLIGFPDCIDGDRLPPLLFGSSLIVDSYVNREAAIHHQTTLLAIDDSLLMTANPTKSFYISLISSSVKGNKQTIYGV